MYIILALLAFGILVTIHELGHFILAKLNNVKVDEFAIGMGPKLFSIKGKETEYSLKALPIGGYVKMFGEEEGLGDPRAFMSKSPLQKISIVAAGAIMNFFLAVLIFSIISFNNGYIIPKVSEILPNSPAEKVGLKPGDVITEINSNNVLTWEDFTLHLMMSNGGDVDIKYKRDGQLNNIILTPEKDEAENRFKVGVGGTIVKEPALGSSISQGFKQSISTINQAFFSLKTIFTGKAKLNDVGGPVTIIRVSGAAAKAGIWNLMWFTALLSVQLAVFNLLPFPALDGGWVFILLIELITRRKVSDKIIQTVNYIGMSLLLILMFLVTVKDILFPIKL
ncbi:RIP metalloprotease RseP [Clostridium polynesiense]|uniref:RIP metalloprotease RseP n=1 Tax=Clostridium polynesiense TaxID=1325933 RepID=UPI00058CBFD2|nr:RIP metalloprotease RseP [Clostridium polynesiense]